MVVHRRFKLSVGLSQDSLVSPLSPVLWRETYRGPLFRLIFFLRGFLWPPVRWGSSRGLGPGGVEGGGAGGGPGLQLRAELRAEALLPAPQRGGHAVGGNVPRAGLACLMVDMGLVGLVGRRLRHGRLPKTRCPRQGRDFGFKLRVEGIIRTSPGSIPRPS